MYPILCCPDHKSLQYIENEKNFICGPQRTEPLKRLNSRNNVPVTKNLTVNNGFMMGLYLWQKVSLPKLLKAMSGGYETKTHFVERQAAVVVSKCNLLVILEK